MKNVYEKITGYNKELLPHMLELRYDLMNRNYYRFFRGSCHLFYEDLYQIRRQLPFSPITWVCGDLHMENFGTYKGDNRLVYFDINDFDESILAPASWEIVHFLCSLYIAFDTLELEEKKAHNMARHFLKKYSEILSKGKSLYIEPQTAQGILHEFLSAVSKRTQKDLLKKRTVKENGIRKLVINKKFLEIDPVLKSKLTWHLTDWILNQSGSPYNFEVADVVFRRAGLGSLGLKRYVALLRSTNVEEKYLLIDMKEARTSALTPYVKIKQPVWPTEAERIIAIQQRMQNVSPALLSTTTFEKVSYVLHEMHPTKDNLNFDLIKHDYRNIYQAINDMAVITASAQLRSSGRQGASSIDELISFGENNNWQETLLDISLQMAHSVKQNYLEFHEKYTGDVPEPAEQKTLQIA